jgi:hypothetical protein
VLVLAGLALVLQVCEFYRQRFFLHPRSEAGFHWRAGILRFAKWPFILLASVEAALNVRHAYSVTRKVPGSSAPWSLLAAHGATASLIAAAWIIGSLRGAATSPILDLLTVVILVAAAAVSLTAFLRFPDPYQPRLLAAAQVRNGAREADIDRGQGKQLPGG